MFNKDRLTRLSRSARKFGPAIFVGSVIGVGAGIVINEETKPSKSQLEASMLEIELNSAFPVTSNIQIEEGYKLPLPNHRNMYDWNPIKLDKDTYGYFVISKLGKVTVEAVTYDKPLQPAPIGKGPKGKSFQGLVTTEVELINNGFNKNPNFFVTTGNDPNNYNSTSADSPVVGDVQPEKIR